MDGVRELPRRVERRGVVVGLDPFGSLELSGPIEAIDSVRWHNYWRPPAKSPFYHQFGAKTKPIRCYVNCASGRSLGG